MPVSLFPFDIAEKYLRETSDELTRDGNCLRWPSYDGISELVVRNVQEKTFDGLLVSELVTLTHTSALLNNVTTEMAAEWNRLATISSIVTADKFGPSRFISKVGIFSTDRTAAEQVYAPLICSQAALVGWHAALFIRGQFSLNPGQSSGLAMTDEPPPFDMTDFEAAKSYTDHIGFLGSLGDHHFTVEFPWAAGAKSNLFVYNKFRNKWAEDFVGVSTDDLDQMAGATSVFQIFNCEHPLYGNGVLSQLEIPLPIKGTLSANLVDELNHWELSGADLPPLFGAWCVGNRAPAFVSFIPNQFCLPGILVNLAAWAFARHDRVRQWLGGSTTAN
jgi:hypothetical protein